MGYDPGESFPFDFEPNGISFGSKSKGKLSPRSYPIQCERKWKYSFVSVIVMRQALKRLNVNRPEDKKTIIVPIEADIINYVKSTT